MIENLFRVADEGPRKDDGAGSRTSWLSNPVHALFEAATVGTGKPPFHVRVNRAEFMTLVHVVQGKKTVSTAGEESGVHTADYVTANALAETMFLDGVGTTKPGHLPGLSVTLNHNLRLGA